MVHKRLVDWYISDQGSADLNYQLAGALQIQLKRADRARSSCQAERAFLLFFADL